MEYSRSDNCTVFAVVGYLVQSTFPTVFGAIPWYVWSIAGILLLHFILYRSINTSTKVASVLGVFEVLVFLILSLYILFSTKSSPLAIIMVYILGNIALLVFYRREHPSDFSWWLHGALPIVSSVFMLVALYGSMFPVPAFPLNLSPYIVLVWLVIGVIVLRYLRRNRPDKIEAAKVIVLPDSVGQ